MPKQSFAIPDFLHEAPLGEPAPVELMRQAAANFTEKMGDRIAADVSTINPGGANLFRHKFMLIVPALNDYVNTLFYVWHTSSLYPANLMIAGGKQEVDTRVCANAADLKREIEQVFSADSTGQLVRAFLAQIGDASAAL